MNTSYTPESLKILSLVCGFPKPKRDKRWLIILQAFVDESVQDNSLFVMAGYVAPVEKWLSFADEWQGLLDLNEYPHRPIQRFKMRQLRHKRGLHRAEMFYKVIEAHASAAFSCTIDVTGMRKAIKEFAWPSWVIEPEKLSNPYYFAFQAIAESLAVSQEKLGLFEPIDFVFDEHTSKGPCIEAWDALKENSADDVCKYLGDTPIFRPEETMLPLQAADLYAYWVRKWAAEGDDDGVKDLKFSWKAERDIPRFSRVFSEKDFKLEFENRVKVIESGVVDKSSLLPRLNLEINYSKDS